jgi:hypothetical protein
MKATRIVLYTLIAISFLSCDKEDDRTFSSNNGQFVRFFFQLNQDNQPLEAPAIEPAIPAVSLFQKEDVKTIKIPVAITSQPLQEPVIVTYEALISGINNLDITPSELSFQGTQLVDTLFVQVTERWDPASSPSLLLRLTESSNPAIDIGMPNELQPLNELLINFADFELNYGITSPSRVDVIGNNEEIHDITIGFPMGYIASEVIGMNLFLETQSNFNYTLEQLPFISSKEITYRLTINQDFTNDDLLYKTSFALNNINEYDLNGNPSVSLLREPLTPRDRALNTASNFYDSSNSFYRLYGVNWMDNNTDTVCAWQDFNAFVIPIEVPINDPDAILGDDMGTTDPTDDIYYHAFQIGFKSPITSNTTNPFNLKRWFTNESTSSSISPGFNILPALEFYPDNGTSATSGTVQVIEQTIRIGTTATNGSITEFITINGSGTYSEISPGIFDIDLTFNASNNRLFGGTRTAKYHLYNTNGFTDPPLLNEACFIPIAL